MPNVNVGALYGDNFDQLFCQLVHFVHNHPQYICSPRGSKIKETLATTLVLNNPRARLLGNKSRDATYGFGVGEFLWYWQGKNDLESMLYYNKRMKDFSDDGKTLNSAYGYRLREMQFQGGNQWATAIKTLVDDPDSRRCVLHINLPEDERKAATVGSKDVPCTLTMQFFIRDNKLDLHVLMRSNDIVWGLTYDLFSFTLFQECMLLDLKQLPQFKDLELGTYYHTAGSLHLYERHFDLADKILREYQDPNFVAPQPMEALSSIGDLSRLCSDESLLRNRDVERIDENGYAGGLKWMAAQLNAHREKRDAEAAR